MKRSVSVAKAWLPVAGGLLLLVLLSTLGKAAVAGSGLAIPGPVVGTAVYLALLLAAPRFFAWTLAGARLMTSILGALIVPAAVGLAGFASELRADALPLAITLVVSTLVTGVATAALYRLFARL